MIKTVKPNVDQGAPVEKKVVVCDQDGWLRSQNDNHRQNNGQDDGAVVMSLCIFHLHNEGEGFSQIHYQPYHDEERKQASPIIHVGVELHHDSPIGPKEGCTSLQIAWSDVHVVETGHLLAVGLVVPEFIKRRLCVCDSRQR